MAHFSLDGTKTIRTPIEWLSLGSEIGQIANEWAGRGDIIAYVGPGAADTGPACFYPKTAEVEVNIKKVFGEAIQPYQIGNMQKRETHYDWPHAAGAIFHEALHARYSLYDLETAVKELNITDANVHDNFFILEESRIEALGVEMFPSNTVFLRASAMTLIVDDIQSNISKQKSIRVLARILGLVLARVDAGVLYSSDVKEIEDVLVEFFGVEIIEKFRSIWLRAQGNRNGRDAVTMLALAQEWEDLIKSIMKDKGEEEESGTGAGSGPGFAKVIEKIISSIEEASQEISISINESIQDQQQQEEWESVVKALERESKQQNEHKKESEKVFSMSLGVDNTDKTFSKLIESRVPTSRERAAAVKIAQMLEKAKYRERDEIEISSILPPGRLRTRAIVQNAAYAAQGKMDRAEAWRRTVRRHTEDPTLTIGVMVDISGSMSSAMQPMAVTAWAISEASRRVQGRCAMVYYGNSVFPTLKPGQHLTNVNVFTASDGTEQFDKGFKALNGSLNLLNGSGARLLVIVSDAGYTQDQRSYARKWIKACDAAGVAVLWLGYTNTHGYIKEVTEGTNAVTILGVKQPADAAIEIGMAAARALEKVGNKVA